jgi:hypothetical protein
VDPNIAAPVLEPVGASVASGSAASPVPGEPWRRGGPAPWGQTPDDLPGARSSSAPVTRVERMRAQRPRPGLRTVTAIVVVVVVALGAYVLLRGHQPKPPSHLASYMAHGGVTYAPHGLHYQVLLPVRPRETTEIDPSGSRPTTLHVAEVADPQYLVQVSVESVPDAPTHAKVYDYLHKTAVKMERTASVSNAQEHRMVHEGMPAVQSTATASGWQVDNTLVYANGRLYRITVRARTDGPGVLARVMRSFHVTKG